MSLQGTFDTLSVTELFGLLSTASKTGALRLEAGEHAAAVFVNAGRCCAVESDDATGPARTGDELASRLVDVGFTLARHPSGSFRFSDSERPPFDAPLTTPFEAAVAEITSMLNQWKEIEATIPSLDVRVRLAPVLRGEQIILSAHEWSLLAALDDMPSVREVVARRGEPVIQVCRLVKDLADRGAIDVGTDIGRNDDRVDVESEVPTEVPSARARRVRDEAAASLLDRSEPCAPNAAPATGPAGVAAIAAAANAVVAAEAAGVEAADAVEATADASSGDGSQDRGALLRLFSALKES